MVPSRTKIWVMTMLETDWPEGLEVDWERGFVAEAGVADCDAAGDAREILDPPPPLVALGPPCVAKPAEEGDWEAAEDAILAREGSWAEAACCACEGEKVAAAWLAAGWVCGFADVEMGGSRGCMETCAWIPPGAKTRRTAGRGESATIESEARMCWPSGEERTRAARRGGGAARAGGRRIGAVRWRQRVDERERWTLKRSGWEGGWSLRVRLWLWWSSRHREVTGWIT
jgi:hypothetical protein